jgi:hypothetical protein
MQEVPVQPIPRQSLQIQLQDQPCTLTIYQYAYGLFVDVYVNGVLVVGGVIAQNLNRIVRYRYFDFLGDFVFFDTQGSTDPVYTGLGSRYVLLYLGEDELPEE